MLSGNGWHTMWDLIHCIHILKNMQYFGDQSSVATMILQPVVLRSCLVEKEFDERCMIEGDVHRSRKWLSFSDINVRTEWSLDKACFNYSRGETQDIGYCMQGGHTLRWISSACWMAGSWCFREMQLIIVLIKCIKFSGDIWLGVWLCPLWNARARTSSSCRWGLRASISMINLTRVVAYIQSPAAITTRISMVSSRGHTVRAEARRQSLSRK